MNRRSLAAISWTMVWHLTSGVARPFWLMKEKRRSH
jgi:hypothetical protein